MLSLNLEKQKLRKIFNNKRTSLLKEEVQIKSLQINNNFISNLLPKIYKDNSDKIFSLYLDSYNEVSTATIANHFTENKIKFSYPKIIQKNHPLDFILFEQNQDYAANTYFPKILEPINGKKVIPDILILPLLAFDPYLSRLGMGGGFFDRTIESLKQQNSQIIIIGLAYDFQRLDSILPSEKTDRRLDFVVTEKIIFS